MIMISCFDYSTIMAKPWAEAGYTCYCIDLQHKPGEIKEGNIIKVGCDLRDWLPPKGNIVFAAFFPPCTDLATSGARWFKQKGLMRRVKAMELVAISEQIAEWCNAPYFIENPVGVLNTHWRKPDYMFHPYEYGDPYTKKTCLWTGNGFVMPDKNPVEPVEGSKILRLPPSEDRQNLRSETPKGFANAVFRCNQPNEVK